MSAFLFVMSAVIFNNWATWEIPSAENLTNISGVVMAVEFNKAYKTSGRMKVQVIENDKIHYLSQKDLTKKIVALKSLRQGDSINTLVSFDSIGSYTGFIWEIRRGSEVLLSREAVFKLA